MFFSLSLFPTRPWFLSTGAADDYAGNDSVPAADTRAAEVEGTGVEAGRAAEVEGTGKEARRAAETHAHNFHPISTCKAA